MSLKFLVIDDSQADRDNLVSILNTKGYTSLTADRADLGIEVAAKEKPALIFLDVVMPEGDGYGACRKLKKDPQTKDIPVCFVTAKNQKADHIMGEMQGGSGHIGKPYSAEQIFDVISKIVN